MTIRTFKIKKEMGKGILGESIEIIFKNNIIAKIVPEDMCRLHTGCIYIKII